MKTNFSELNNRLYKLLFSNKELYDKLYNTKVTKKLPKYLYHKGNPKFRDNVLKEGLKPQVGDSYWTHYESEYGTLKNELKPVIFLYDKNLEDYDSTYDDNIYQIDTSKLNNNKIRIDNALPNGCFIYLDIIKPTSFKLLYKGTGNSLI